MKLRPLLLFVAFFAYSVTARAQLDFFKPQEEKPKAAAPARFGNDKIAVTAALLPARARRGQEIELLISFDIKPGFHAFPTKQADPNAQAYTTTVELISADAAKLPRAEQKKVTAAIELVGEYSNSATVDRAAPDENITARSEFEGKASITGKFRVKLDAKPGPLELIANVAGSVCNDNFCTPFSAAIPLTLTVTDERAPASSAPPPPHVVSSKGQERMQASASLEPLMARRGQVLSLKVVYDIRPGFHSYPTVQSDPNAASFVSSIELAASEDRKATGPVIVELVGDWKNSAVKMHAEPALDIKSLASFEGKATIEGSLRVKADTVPGVHQVVVRVRGQVCDEENTCAGFNPAFSFHVTVLEGEPLSVGTAPTTPNPKAPTAPTRNAVAEQPRTTDGTQALGFWAFILQGAGFGFISLFTPCVFPMIPITVSFFLKQSEKEHHKPVTMALVYSLTIVVVLTLAAVALIQTLTTVSQWPSTNFLIGALFIVLALSLFGMYEIQLPASLARYTSAQEGRGGFIGTIFMALTFTIISFTCVAPFLGGFAGTTQQGRPFWEQLLGGLAFSVTFALPFFILALFPSLIRKLPKSGSWLNNVKVVMGFVELAAAFGFFRSAEVYLRGKEPTVIFTYDLVLGMWVALSIVCGVYLLGLFRLSHDTPHEHLGVPRLLVSCLFLGFGLYLLPGLFTTEQSRNRGEVYVWVDAFLLPETGTKTSTASAPGVKSEHLVWDDNLQKSMAEAARTPGQLVFIDFTGKACKNCRYNERNVFTNAKVSQRLEKFKLVQLYTDTVDEEHQRNQKFMVEKFNTIELPLYVILKPLNDGKYEELGRVGGKINSIDGFAEFLQKALDKNGGQVAASR
jgi:thiol:disulfide interchange protein